MRLLKRLQKAKNIVYHVRLLCQDVLEKKTDLESSFRNVQELLLIL